MTRPDCAVMCNLINTHTHTHTMPSGGAVSKHLLLLKYLGTLHWLLEQKIDMNIGWVPRYCKAEELNAILCNGKKAN